MEAAMSDISKTEAKEAETQNQEPESSSEQTCTNGEKINTDGRKPYDWESRYPIEAQQKMKFDAGYIATVLIISIIALVMLLRGCLWTAYVENSNLDEERLLTFESLLIYFFSGLLGGTVYGMKYFYRVVARGFWSLDRRYWRIFSPWISACIALVVGCMMTSGFITSVETQSILASICIGFVAGYFADDAVSKMSEVAKALFGTSSGTK